LQSFRLGFNFKHSEKNSVCDFLGFTAQAFGASQVDLFIGLDCDQALVEKNKI